MQHLEYEEPGLDYGTPSNASNTLMLPYFLRYYSKLITDNIVGAFTEANFAAVVFFAIVFGCALGTVHLKRQESGEGNFVMPLFMELDKCFLTIINWIIMITPFAVLSLIAAAVGIQDNLPEIFENVAYLVIAWYVAS